MITLMLTKRKISDNFSGMFSDMFSGVFSDLLSGMFSSVFSEKFSDLRTRRWMHSGLSHRGLTLVEVSMTILLAGILLTGGYTLSRAQNRGLVAARSNNLSLWILEGTRNRILTEMVPFGAVDEKKLKAVLEEVRLPPGLKLKAEKISPEEGKRAILQLSLADENQNGMSVSRTLSREIELNE
ncbi:MAG: prepilin-type N-terminal cleavage/methylation domain-containing protein [Candidatus Ozemobacteraceae bacterium]